MRSTAICGPQGWSWKGSGGPCGGESRLRVQGLRVCVCARVCVYACGLYIAWVHLWMCAKARVFVCVREGKRVVRAMETLTLVGIGWGGPFLHIFRFA